LKSEEITGVHVPNILSGRKAMQEVGFHERRGGAWEMKIEWGSCGSRTSNWRAPYLQHEKPTYVVAQFSFCITKQRYGIRWSTIADL
jgi:hypothetical protein